MDISRLRQALGLAEDTAESVVMEKAAAMLTEGKVAKDQLSQFGAAIQPHGLKLDQGRVLKVIDMATGRPDLEVRDTDTPDTKALKTALKAEYDRGGSAQLSSVTTEIEAGIKAGKIPPAVKDHFEALLSIQGQSHRWMLASDGKTVVAGVMNAADHVRKILEALPKLTGEQLTQTGAVTVPGTPETTPTDGKYVNDKAGELTAEGKKYVTELAARAEGRKLDATPAGVAGK